MFGCKRSYRLILLIVQLVLIISCSANDDNVNSLNSDKKLTTEPPAGTWIDYDTGLMWQNPTEMGFIGGTWDEENSYCENLVLAQYSNWRLPSISELRSIVRGCKSSETNGTCGVNDDCLKMECRTDECNGCEPKPDEKYYWPDELEGNPYTINGHWSVSQVGDDDKNAWIMIFYSASIQLEDKDNILDEGLTTRCVRTMTTE